jgi:hypothetical protein
VLSRRSKADAQNSYSDRPPVETVQPCPKIHDKEVLDKGKWLEIELIGEDDEPIAGETYRITLSDGTLVKEGALDIQGYARIEGIAADMCFVSFPNLHENGWEKIDDKKTQG